MGKNSKPISPTPEVIPEGSHAWQEYTIRREMPDGRVVDSDPMSEGSAMMARSFAIFARPPAARVVVRRRRVSTFASPWEDVAVAENDDGSPAPAEDVQALDATDGRTAEDLPVLSADGNLDDLPGFPFAMWWVPVDADGKEIIARRPYRPGVAFVVGKYADQIVAMGFAEAEHKPLFLTVPVDAAVTPGDRISVAGPASGGQVPVQVDPPHEPDDPEVPDAG